MVSRFLCHMTHTGSDASYWESKERITNHVGWQDFWFYDSYRVDPQVLINWLMVHTASSPVSLTPPFESILKNTRWEQNRKHLLDNWANTEELSHISGTPLKSTCQNTQPVPLKHHKAVSVCLSPNLLLSCTKWSSYGDNKKITH